MKSLSLKSAIVLAGLFLSILTYAQRFDIGLYVGRFWATYKYVDYGDGYKNANASNWSNFPTVTLNYKLKDRSSLEYFFTYARYAQYFSTNKYPGAFYSNFGVGYFGVHFGYAFLKKDKVELRMKVGGSIGVMPDQYEGTFERIFVYPYVDSITRGTINRSYTPIFPMLSGGLDFTYKIRNRLGISLAMSYQKGLIKISEYDIYYNNGSGKNDQRARQWEKGDFYGFQFGVRYDLKK